MAKATADIRSLARAQTALAIRTLTGVCSSKAAPAAARVSAASALLDRGWGRAPQQYAGEDDRAVHVIIRDIVEDRRQQTTTTVPPTPPRQIPRPAGSLGGGGVVVRHGHPHHLVEGRDKD